MIKKTAISNDGGFFLLETNVILNSKLKFKISMDELTAW